MFSFWVLWFIPCAIANRIRGGWLANDIKAVFKWWSTTPARIFVSCVISTPIWITHEPIKALIFNVLLFVGFIFRWSPWNIMLNPFVDTLMLTLRGLCLTFAPGLFIGYKMFSFCGLLMGITYYIAYKLDLYHEDKNGYVWVSSDWGELFFGGVLGFFMGLNTYLMFM